MTDIGADHHARQGSGGLVAGIAGSDLLSEAQDRGGVAQPLHFFELMRNIENGAAFAPQPFQNNEKLIGLLRRENRGRLIENEQLGIPHQHTHNFNALAFADGEPPHFSLRVERKAVFARNLCQSRRHG